MFQSCYWFFEMFWSEVRSPRLHIWSVFGKLVGLEAMAHRKFNSLGRVVRFHWRLIRLPHRTHHAAI